MHSLTPDYLATLRFGTQQLATLRALGEYRSKQLLYVAQLIHEGGEQMPFSEDVILQQHSILYRDMLRLVLRVMKAEGLIAPTAKRRGAG